jgi:hypothetical protein
MRAALKVRQKRGGHADGAEKIGGYHGLGVGQVGLLGMQLFSAHDAGIVDEHIERGKLGGDLSGKGFYGFRPLDIEREGPHSRVSGGGFIERGLAAAGDDYVVSKRVKGLSKAAADT